MKRFYREATVGAEGGVLLDGRPVKTPSGRALEAPTPALREAIVAEWNAQGEKIDPRSMPLTGLANAALDRVAPDQDACADGLARYGESDLLCYRAEGPQGLVDRQAASWDPILDWARRYHDVDFEIIAGVTHRPQPRATVERLAHAVHARDAFTLAALSPLVTIGGSLVIALALAERAIDLETAWNAASLDEQWQIEKWGADAEAVATLAARRRDFEAADRFLGLL